MTGRRRPLLAAGLAACLLVALTGCPFWEKEPVTVEISDGALRGIIEEGVRSWRGIPYAAAPEDELRWRPPQPPEPWSGERDAAAFEEPCLQAPEGFPEKGSEDCLYLNVFRADDRGDDELPVMVWIHGGGLDSGEGDLPIDTVTGLTDKGVVLVSMNYRLGRLGFFTHPALEKENPQRVANFGFLDQVAALQWVQRNIGAFGGDPDNVTIFGASAGGAAVNSLMSSPSAEGLFDKAIAGSPLGREQPEPWADALVRGEELAASVGEPDADAEALRSIDGGTIAALPGHILRGEVPIIDSVLPRSVADTFAAGEEAAVPYIVGSTDLELIDDHYALIGVDAEALRAQLIAGHEDEAAEIYGDDEEYARHFLNDLVFAEPARYLAELHARRAPTYLYRFSIAGEEVRDLYGGALHGADLPYVFGLNVPDKTVDESRELADEISGCWQSFAAEGEPTCADATWPAAGKGEFMEFTNGGPVVVTEDPWSERLDFAELMSTTLRATR